MDSIQENMKLAAELASLKQEMESRQQTFQVHKEKLDKALYLVTAGTQTAEQWEQMSVEKEHI